MVEELQVTVLGAGQDVGRSCVVVTFPSKRVVFDCGAHCGFVDSRRYPALQLLGNTDNFQDQVDMLMSLNLKDDELMGKAIDEECEGTIEAKLKDDQNEDSYKKNVCLMQAMKQVCKEVTNTVECVIISHLHLDHSGAVPFLTENLGYKGPVFMTYPTKALAPILLKDSSQLLSNKWQTSKSSSSTKGASILLGNDKKRKTNVDQPNDPWGYTLVCATASISKSIPLQLKSTKNLSNINLTPYYAGHVLGAAIFAVECDGFSVVYTGDFNTIPDKHLGPAKVPPIKPDVLICESTYATLIRPPRKSTEMELCTIVHDCLVGGGKVLIPVFAVGRAQELAIILDSYWSKLKIGFPIYFGGGLSEKATSYYKLHSTWTHSGNRYNLNDNSFHLNHISPFDNSFANEARPMVLFATPGMLHAGLSLRICKMWSGDPKNLIVIPGYCVQGTVGNRLIAGEKRIPTPNGVIEIKCKIRYLSFSAHADSAGISQLIRHISPRNVVLVHGEYEGMKKYAKQYSSSELPIYYPANGQTIKFYKRPKETPIYYYPTLALEARGLQVSLKHELGVSVTNEPTDVVRTIAVKVKSNSALKRGLQDKLILISRSFLQNLSNKDKSETSDARVLSLAPLHRIIERRVLKMSQEQFMAITDYIAKVVEVPGLFKDVKVKAEELANGAKRFTLKSLVAEHMEEKVELQWNYYEYRPSSAVSIAVELFTSGP